MSAFIYTHLESLLLFQTLLSEGANSSINFTRISDQLKQIPLIRSDPTYDDGRLSPNALKDLYLGLLKEEAKLDIERQKNGDAHITINNNAAANGDTGSLSPASRKRKAASPDFPTVQEAAQHSHLIPQLVARLYARYRDNIVRNLRSQEYEYVAISREIADLRSGRLDARLQQQHQQQQLQQQQALRQVQASPSGQTHASIPRGPPQQEQNGIAYGRGTPSNASASAGQVPPPVTSLASRAGPDPDLANRGTAGSAPLAQQTNPAATGRSSSTPGEKSQVALPTPQAPQPGGPTRPAPNAPPQVQPMPSTVNRIIAPNQLAGYPQPIAAAPHGHPRPDALPAQHSTPRPLSVRSNVQPAMPIHARSPVQQLASPAPHASPYGQVPQQFQHQQQQQQNRALSSRSQTPEGTVRRGSATPVPQHQAIQPSQQPHPDRQVAYAQPTQNQSSNYRPSHAQSGGYMLPPFQLTPQGPNRQMQMPIQQIRTPQHVNQAPIQVLQAQQIHAQGRTTPATAPRLQIQPRPIPNNNVAALVTPVRPRLKSIWKSDVRPYSNSKPTLQTRPDVEPLSPTRDRQRSPNSSSRATQSNPMGSLSSSENIPIKTRQVRKRPGAAEHGPPSLKSTGSDESARASLSEKPANTNTGHSGVLNEERTGSQNCVKVEPTTPAASIHGDSEPMVAPSPLPTSGPATRKRRGTMTSQAVSQAKRKRHESPSEQSEEHNHPASSPAPLIRTNKVAATRNFAKMSSAIMHDIESHKHASYFRMTLRDRDVPGYESIVLEPRSLKFIRSAISAGKIAVANATAASSSAAESPAATPNGTRPAENVTTIELDRADLVNPYAIVNGTQLEKEIMRMLANAYMFNPGEDGMAEITKEMFNDVQQKISDWRGTERLLGGDEDDDGKGGKRRKA